MIVESECRLLCRTLRIHIFLSILNLCSNYQNMMLHFPSYEKWLIARSYQRSHTFYVANQTLAAGGQQHLLSRLRRQVEALKRLPAGPAWGSQTGPAAAVLGRRTVVWERAGRLGGMRPAGGRPAGAAFPGSADSSPSPPPSRAAALPPIRQTRHPTAWRPPPSRPTGLVALPPVAVRRPASSSTAAYSPFTPCLPRRCAAVLPPSCLTARRPQ